MSWTTPPTFQEEFDACWKIIANAAHAKAGEYYNNGDDKAGNRIVEALNRATDLLGKQPHV